MPIHLTSDEQQRRAIAMRAAVADRKARRIASPMKASFGESEHPVITCLWDTLEYLVDDSMFLYGYFDAISNGNALNLVKCFEQSARENGLRTRTERMLELYAALTCDDPATIADVTLRRVVSMARLTTARPAL